ncbi:MAG: hypothetical protein RR854_00390 [Muribaculaceae bacterium]
MKTIAYIFFIIAVFSVVGAITIEQLHPIQISIFSIILGMICYPSKDKIRYRNTSQAYRDTNDLNNMKS